MEKKKHGKWKKHNSLTVLLYGSALLCLCWLAYQVYSGYAYYTSYATATGTGSTIWHALGYSLQNAALPFFLMVVLYALAVMQEEIRYIGRNEEKEDQLPDPDENSGPEA